MGFMNRTLDVNQRIIAATSYTATTTTTAVQIKSVGSGDESLELILDLSVKGGTHDSSNYFQVVLEAGETSGGTYYAVDGFVITSDVIATGATIIGLNTRQITEAVGSQDANYYRLVITKVGTTATDVTLEAYLQKA